MGAAVATRGPPPDSHAVAPAPAPLHQRERGGNRARVTVEAADGTWPRCGSLEAGARGPPSRDGGSGLNGDRERHPVTVRIPGSGGPEGPPSRDGGSGLNGDRERHPVAVRSGGPPCHST